MDTIIFKICNSELYKALTAWFGIFNVIPAPKNVIPHIPDEANAKEGVIRDLRTLF